VPSQAGLDLRQIDVAPAQQHFSHNTAISVALAPLDGNLSAVDQVGQPFFRALPEWLPLLRGINSSEANSVLSLAFVQERQRVAVLDGDHYTLEGVGQGTQMGAQGDDRIKQGRGKGPAAAGRHPARFRANGERHGLAFTAKECFEQTPEAEGGP